MKQRMRQRRARPAMEGLEERLLLRVQTLPATRDLVASRPGNLILPQNNPTLLKIGHNLLTPQQFERFLGRLPRSTTFVMPSDRRLLYTTPEGTRVSVTLYGLGSLQGSSVDANGVLDLVYSGTTANSAIVGKVFGGTGQAPLRSIQNGFTALRDYSGSGATPIGTVNLKNFNLIDGGIINLTGEVGQLLLRSMGENAQVHLKAIPAPSSTGVTGTSSSVSTAEVISSTAATSGATVTTTAASSMSTSPTTSNPAASQSSAVLTGGATTGGGASSSGGASAGQGGAASTAGSTSASGVLSANAAAAGISNGLGGGVVGSTGVGASAIGVGNGVGAFGSASGINAISGGGGGGEAVSLSGTSVGGSPNTGSAAPFGGQAGTVQGVSGGGAAGGGGPGGGGGGPGGGGGRAVVTGASVGASSSLGGSGLVGLGSASVDTPASTNVNLSIIGGGTSGGTVPVISGTGSAITGVVTTTGGVPTTKGKLGSATGINVVIDYVNGVGRSVPLGDPQIFAIDPRTNSLIRFDATTGVPQQTIPITGMGAAIAGVALAYDNGQTVALVGDGTVIQAYDAISGAFVGQFSTANLAPLGMPTINMIGSTGTRTVIGDSTAGAYGLMIQINVTQSLMTGQAVPVTSTGQPMPFGPQNQFELAGGLTGVAASDTIYALGAAHFNTFEPSLTQLGFMTIATSNSGTLTTTSMGEVGGPPSIQTVGPPGTAHSMPIFDVGSVDQELALIIDSNNDMALYNRSTLQPTGLVHLQYPNPLTGLSESFHPELVDQALVDVQGDLRSFRSLNANGLVLNDNGTLSLVQIHNAANATIVGRPVAHVRIPRRNNVSIFSTLRVDATQTTSLGTRSGVTKVNPNQPIMGPLFIP
jgi:hypothetical protein